MNILLWIVFGTIVGTVINAIDPAPKRNGMVSAMLLGIVGALIGGLLANIIFGMEVSGFNTASFFVAIGGSFLLLLAGKTIRKT